MKKIIKRIIVILSIILLIFIITLISYYKLKNENSNKTNVEYNNQSKQTFELLRDNSMFYGIVSSMNVYLSDIFIENKKSVVDKLDEAYMDNNGISEQNVLSYVGKIEDRTTFNLKKAYYIERDDIVIYFLLGNLNINTINGTEEKESYNAIFKYDKSNYTYSIYPCRYESVEEINVEDLKDKFNSINKNSSNEFNYVLIDNVEIAKKYFLAYKNLMLKNFKEAYNKLDEEYKNKRFKSVEMYEAYIKNNKDRIERISLQKYTIDHKENYNQHICIDNFGNYYIFEETSPMQYTVLLDSYTVPTDEFINRYNSSNEKLKAAMNVQKFIEMVNNKDYESINNVLAGGFKKQYSINQNNCNKLINNIFYDLNSLKSATGELQGNYYVIKCEILNEENYNESKKINFIVSLKENLNFEIAFSENKE